MKIKLFCARLHTAGKTAEEILAEFDDPKPTEEEIKQWIKVYDGINGAEVIVMESLLGDGFIPIGWEDEDDDAFRDFVYQAEQDPFFGSYINEREEFIKDWKSGDYSPAGSLTFRTEEVEILEEMKQKQM